MLSLWLTSATMVLGFLLGTGLAVLRMSGNPVLSALSWGYVWIFRSTPLIVQLLRRIVLPQTMRSIVAAAGNMLIGTLKGTSIVSMIAVQDLLYSVQLIYNRNYLIIPRCWSRPSGMWW